MSPKETDMAEASIGVCENCGKTTKVRKIKFFSAFAKASPESVRGYCNICYRCFGPRIIWFKGRTEYRTPMDISNEELEKFMTIDTSGKRTVEE